MLLKTWGGQVILPPVFSKTHNTHSSVVLAPPSHVQTPKEFEIPHPYDMSGQSRATSSQTGRGAPAPARSEEFPEIPTMATPSGNIEFQHIWELLCQMQEQVVSLQESIRHMGAKIIDIEESVNTIKATNESISLHLNELERAPCTPEAQPQGRDETLRPATTIRLPTAHRPHA